MAAGGFLAASGLTSCDDVIGHECTLIGCLNGLHVEIQGLPDTHYEVVVSEPDGESRVGSCVASPSGSCWVWFDDFYPSEVTINVTGADQTVSVTLQPAYQESQPNGPDCGPTCREATIEIDFRPGAQLSNRRLEPTR